MGSVFSHQNKQNRESLVMKGKQSFRESRRVQPKMSLKQSISQRMNTFSFAKRKSTRIDIPSQNEYFQRENPFQAAELKKCVMEINVVGSIHKVKRSTGFQLELRIADDVIVEWFESKRNSHQILKKVRFPFKFKYINSDIMISVTPILKDDHLQQQSTDSSIIKEINQEDDTIYFGVFNFNQVYKNKLNLTEAYDIPIQQSLKNVMSLSMQEVKTQANITINFLLQLPESERYLIEKDYSIKIQEYQGIYEQQIKILKRQVVDDYALNLVICIPNYDEEQFKERQFEIRFEEYYLEPETSQTFITQEASIIAIVKFTGEDLQYLELVQTGKEPQQKKNFKINFDTNERYYSKKSTEINDEYDTYQDKVQNDFQVNSDDEVNDQKSPRRSISIFTQDMTQVSKALLQGPIDCEAYTYFSDHILSGEIQVLPLIAIDFSLANLTFSDDQCLHSTKPNKQNDYRDVLKAICDSYQNVLNIPIYGYSAKTIKQSLNAAEIFPLSQDLQNPFISNSADIIDQSYTNCLKQLELSTPINLKPLFSMIKKLGQNLRLQTQKNGKIDCFYVIYILSAGLIDDLPDLLASIDQEWETLPIQVHLINLSATNIITDDLDTIKFQDYTMKFNLQQSCWFQFNVHYYDRIKFKYGNNTETALAQLKEQTTDSVLREIETYLFLNQLKPNITENPSEVVQQSLYNILEVMEEMNLELLQKAKDHGIREDQLLKLINSKKLYEWNIETAKILLKE